ncbi:16S rRNA (guanine527-N7)-methyltransferase [Spiroplasma sp. TIUS-1]|uniref:16S rRNA (guanine(527)-N(7))-methyltransferase RsmG n=1 Tax=Spiroplasma sp. TIUS-1 TaxID=216963 RepID=UPI001398E626|nr:16S rRNA (guanine(527)-N(7))-methyltransferase RsmG [Spiroplasma sp. TIUS-1]QHX36222.1 16S rRNA (guanine527-N7)-methyltransferase [Spiroplasma sp. TIUS-1]
MTSQAFKNLVKSELNIELTNKQLEMLSIYFDFLVEENKKYNLTTIVDKEEVYVKHFFDSLIVAKGFKLNNKKIFDIGSGAGFPGLVLAIVFENSEFVLIDSNNKKTTFLTMLINKLGLTNVQALNARAEDLSKIHKHEADIVMARAVARLTILLEISSQIIKVGGSFIGLKARTVKEEIEELGTKPHKLGFQQSEIQIYENELIGIRNNIEFKKISETAPKYPRHYSQIKKDVIVNKK